MQNVCRAITRAVKQAKEGLLISSIVQRFLLDLPLRLLVLLLGRLLPLLRSTATTGAPMLEASGKTSGKRAGPARIMHTMAKINPQEHSLGCIALSAEVCGLRHYRLTFWPPITSLAHFHPLRKPPQGSKPDGNVRFPAGTLLLLEVSFAASHAQAGDPRVRHLLQGPATVEAIRGRHGFTLATTPLELPEGPWPRAASSTTDNQCVRTLDPDSSGARILLNQGQWTAEAGTGDLAATAPGLLPFVLQLGSGRMKPVLLPPGASLATFLILSSSKCSPGLLGSRCQQSPSMYLGGGKPPCTTSRSMCTMSCAWGTLRLPWSGAACSIRLQQGSPLPGASRSSRFPCPMIYRHQTWSHPPSGLCGPCSHCKAPWLLSRTYLALRRRYPVVANPRPGWRPVVARSRRNWWSGLLPML